MVGVASVGGGQQHPPAPHHVGDAGAGLVERVVRRQFVRGTEGLVLAPAADSAGQVGLGGDGVRPLPVEGGQQGRVARLEVDVRGAGGEIQRPDAVPVEFGRVSDRRLVLVVGGAAAAGSERAVAPLVDHLPGQIAR